MRRQRELAGGARAGHFARGLARTKQRNSLRANWLPFGLFLVAGSLVCAFVAWSMPTSFLAGCVVGAAFVTLPGAIWLITVQMTGTAATMMGDDAEQWTAGELRKLSKQGWRLINHVCLRHDDIDHVLLGSGGAYAVETKWSSAWTSSYGRQRIGEAAVQASSNARALRLWHPLKSLGIAPTPVLVLWGPGVSTWPTVDRIRRIGDVTVVAGPALAEWKDELLDAALLTVEQIDRGWVVLEQQVRRRDAIERDTFPLPLSLAGWLVRLSTVVGFTAFGLAAFGQLVSWSHSVPQLLLVACAGLVPSALLIRHRTWPWIAWSWASGLGLPSLALLASQVPAIF